MFPARISAPRPLSLPGAGPSPPCPWGVLRHTHFFTSARCSRYIVASKYFREVKLVGTIDKRLSELGIALPPANAPAGNYVPFVRTGNLLFISGQIPVVDGKPGFIGTLGAALTVEDGAHLRLIDFGASPRSARRRSGSRRALRETLRVCRLHSRIQRSTESHQRRLRPDGRSVWRGRTPCPRGGRHGILAGRRGGRSRSNLRGELTSPTFFPGLA